VDFPLAPSDGCAEVEHLTDSGSVLALDSAPTPPLPMPAVGYGVVLLIEDDPAVRLLGQRVLELHGLTVLPADGADVALELYEHHPGRIDVVLTDVMMPGGNGTDLAARLRTVRPGVRIVFMSGYSFGELEQRG